MVHQTQRSYRPDDDEAVQEAHHYQRLKHQRRKSNNANKWVAPPPVQELEVPPPPMHELLQESQWTVLYAGMKAFCQSYTYSDEIGPVFSERNEHGETPLHVLAWKAPPALVTYMLDRVPDAKLLLMQDEAGNTPLHLACANLDAAADFTVIKNLLLLAPSAVNLGNHNGDTPLHLLVTSAAYSRSSNFTIEAAAEEAITSLLMIADDDIGTRGNSHGATLLHLAIAHGTHERVLVQLLTLHPQAAFCADDYGMLPLHYVAAFSGTPWTFVGQLLWAHPESVTAKTVNGDTALHLLMSNAGSHERCDGYVDRNTTKLAELLVGSGDETVTPFLVTNDEGLSPLHCCALFKTPHQLTKVLMESPLAQAASAIPTNFGATALHLACASNAIADSVQNIEILATRAACDMQDENFRTPLMVAVQNPRAPTHIIRMLCHAYPDIAAQPNDRGYLPIHLALQQTKVKESVIKALIQADPTCVQSLTLTGNTALHEACMHGVSMTVMMLLLEKYPEASYKQNAAGETPLDLALDHDAPQEVISILDIAAAKSGRAERRSKSRSRSRHHHRSRSVSRSMSRPRRAGSTRWAL